MGGCDDIYQRFVIDMEVINQQLISEGVQSYLDVTFNGTIKCSGCNESEPFFGILADLDDVFGIRNETVGKFIDFVSEMANALGDVFAGGVNEGLLVYFVELNSESGEESVPVGVCNVDPEIYDGELAIRLYINRTLTEEEKSQLETLAKEAYMEIVGSCSDLYERFSNTIEITNETIVIENGVTVLDLELSGLVQCDGCKPSEPFFGIPTNATDTGGNSTGALFSEFASGLQTVLEEVFTTSDDNNGIIYIAEVNTETGEFATGLEISSISSLTTKPSFVPTVIPSSVPSVRPSEAASLEPTRTSAFPTVFASLSPTWLPSGTLSTSPSSSFSDKPSLIPSSDTPSLSPSSAFSDKPSPIPSSDTPSISPSSTFSDKPSSIPSSDTPSISPSSVFSDEPSPIPSSDPSVSPTDSLSKNPSMSPSRIPSLPPSYKSSANPSSSPSLPPTDYLSATPTVYPSLHPSLYPSFAPSSLRSPSCDPSTLRVVDITNYSGDGSNMCSHMYSSTPIIVDELTQGQDGSGNIRFHFKQTLKPNGNLQFVYLDFLASQSNSVSKSCFMKQVISPDDIFRIDDSVKCTGGFASISLYARDNNWYLGDSDTATIPDACQSPPSPKYKCGWEFQISCTC